MKILVTGGSGYKGSVLIPKLLKLGHKVINVDTQWFGNNLPKHKNLKNIKTDVNKIKLNDLNGVNTIIHLASIANDPMSEIDKNLSWETSALGTKILVEMAIKKRVKRFIYASSGSVYGIKKETKVHENLSLNPISLYNKVKMVTERVLLSYKNKIEIFIIRPATVCGVSPRLRLDLTVNILSYAALKKKIINVFGGKQIRPNIHIDDITDLYIFFLKINRKHAGIYNAGFENLSVIDIAKKVKKHIKSKIIVKKDFSDPRSYRLDSSKLLKTGFKPKKNIVSAINEMRDLFKKNKIPKKNTESIKVLKKIVRNKKN